MDSRRGEVDNDADGVVSRMVDGNVRITYSTLLSIISGIAIALKGYVTHTSCLILDDHSPYFPPTSSLQISALSPSPSDNHPIVFRILS